MDWANSAEALNDCVRVFLRIETLGKRPNQSAKSAMNESHEPAQDPKAVHFYETAWTARRDVLKGILDAGETNVIRAMNLLIEHDSHFKLTVYPKGSSPAYEWVKSKQGDRLDESGMPGVVQNLFLSEIVRIPSFVEVNTAAYLIAFMKRNGPYDAVIELGAGSGFNLIKLWQQGLSLDVPIFAGELTEGGQGLCRDLFALLPELNVEVFAFDFTKPDLSIVKQRGFKRVFVFSRHAIEQVYQVPPNLFSVLADCADYVDCLHLEPFGFQVDQKGPGIDKLRQAAAEYKWNHNFIAMGLAAYHRGEIRMKCMSPNIFYAGLDNCTSVVWWNTDI